MKRYLKSKLRQHSHILRSISHLSPKFNSFYNINFRKGGSNDIELFSLIDPVLNVELNDAKSGNKK
jgi:hypothetical protein